MSDQPTNYDPAVGQSLISLNLAKAQTEAGAYALAMAEAEGQRIDNRTAEALATTAEISAQREIDTSKWENVSNSRVREYHFTSQVDGDHVDHAMDTITRWHRLDVDDPTVQYKFVICSPGGSVVHGMKLYNTLRGIATKRPLVTVASGLCASMATIIHQAGSMRVIEPGCSYLIHDVSGESMGTVGSMQDTMDWMNKLNHSLHVALAEKSRLTVDEVATLSKRRDAWFMPDEILTMGFADVIGFAIDADASMHVPKVTAAKVAAVRKRVAKAPTKTKEVKS